MNIIDAVKSGLPSNVEECLARKDNPNLQDLMGFTALHWAVIHHHTHLIPLLCQAGAKPNIGTTKHGYTPMHFAAITNQEEALEALLDDGGDIDCKDTEGNTPLELALRFCENSDMYRVLAEFIPALSIGRHFFYDFDSITFLLNRGAILEDTARMHPVIEMAINHDHGELLSAAIARGFKPKAMNKDFWAVHTLGYDQILFQAACNFSVRCLRVLLEANPEGLNGDDFNFNQFIGSNLLCWVFHQFPSNTVFEAPAVYLAENQDPKLTLEEAQERLPEDLKFRDTFLAFDKAQGRYFIQRIDYNYLVLYFDENGQLVNALERCENFAAMLDLFIEKGLKLSLQDALKESTSYYLCRVPANLLQIFIEKGGQFYAEDFAMAVRRGTSDTISLFLTHVSDDELQKIKLTAMSTLMDSDNDRFLSRRGVLVAQLQTRLDALPELVVENTSSITPGFDKIAWLRSQGKKLAEEGVLEEQLKRMTLN